MYIDLNLFQSHIQSYITWPNNIKLTEIDYLDLN